MISIYVSKVLLYAGQKVSFSCAVSQYYFSDGIQWAVKFKNATLLTLKCKTGWFSYASYFREFIPQKIMISLWTNHSAI